MRKAGLKTNQLLSVGMIIIPEDSFALSWKSSGIFHVPQKWMLGESV